LFETLATLRILIADDNQMVRRGILLLLAGEPAWEFCGEVADGALILKTVEELRPDVVLLDVSMPRLNGLEAARLLRQQFPDIKIVIMSQHDPQHLRPRAIEAGADACVDKARIANDLPTAIRSIFRS
jgi:DNA-binding NarL/FixJ family response regulator